MEHPAHYTEGRRFETIDVLEDWFFDNPWLWNTVKYLSRAGRKDDELTDLRKARWYLDRYIARVEGQ